MVHIERRSSGAKNGKEKPFGIWETKPERDCNPRQTNGGIDANDEKAKLGGGGGGGGRRMTVWLDIEGWDQIQMTVVYAPADGVERRSFFRDNEKHIPPHRNQIVVGEFNFAPQPHLDKLSGNTSDGGRKHCKTTRPRMLWWIYG